METHSRSNSVKLVPQHQYFQDGNSGNNPNITPKGEWVTSLDFTNAYFHIPIHHRSRKHMRLFQFTALPFALATATLKFTKVVKEVKLMAQIRGIRIHQYLDDWLLRAPSQEKCRQHTQTLLVLCRKLGWVVNLKKSELTPQQVFNFTGYQFDLLTGRVLPTQERWASLRHKVLCLKTQNTCSQAIHVLDRNIDSHREASLVRSSPHETHTVAPEKTLARSGDSGKDDSLTQISSPTSKLVVG